MHFSKNTVLAVAALLPAAFANIYPDEDPCNPLPGLPGEYEEEFNWRMDLDYYRCQCTNPDPDPAFTWLPPRPYPTETEEEYNARNQIDAQRCAPAFPPEAPPPPPVPFVLVPPPVPLGIIPIPIVAGGPDWRDPAFWFDPVFGVGRPPPLDFLPGARGPPPWRYGNGPDIWVSIGSRRGPDPHRGEHWRPPVGRPEGIRPIRGARPAPIRERPRPGPNRGGPGPIRPEPGRPGPGRPEPPRPEPPKGVPGRPEPGRPEPGRPEPGRPAPGRPEPPRAPAPRPEPPRAPAPRPAAPRPAAPIPRPTIPRPSIPGRPGRPKMFVDLDDQESQEDEN